MVRELFEMARTKKACLIFFDEIDAVGGARWVLEHGHDLTYDIPYSGRTKFSVRTKHSVRPYRRQYLSKKQNY